jgi:hypothetical protein
MTAMAVSGEDARCRRTAACSMRRSRASVRARTVAVRGGRGEGGDLAHQFTRGNDGHGDALTAVLDLHRHLTFEDEVGPGPGVALEEQRLAGRGAVDGRAGREAGEVGRRDRGEARRRAQHPHDAVRVAMVDGSVHGAVPFAAALRRRSSRMVAAAPEERQLRRQARRAAGRNTLC